MKKLLIISSIILVSFISSNAQSLKKSDFFKPYGKGFKTSSIVFWSGVALDLQSSKGGIETNSLFRNKNGKVDTKKVLLISGVGYGISLLMEKKYPKLASAIRFIGGSIHYGAAIHNWRLQN